MLYGFCAGIGLVAAAILYWLICLGVKNIKKWFSRKSDGLQNAQLPLHVRRWVGHVEKHLRRRQSRLKVGVYVGLVGVAAIMGATVGMVLLHNLLAAVMITVLSFVIPEQFLLYFLQVRRNKKFDQLVEACPMFAGELDRVTVTKALGNTGRNIPDPVGRIFRQAERDLIAGHDPEKVFGQNMMRALDFTYGRLFVSLLYDCYYNSALAPMFVDLGVEMEKKRQRLHENTAKLFTERMISVVLILMFIPAYLVASTLVPTTWEFLTTTLRGKLCVCFYLFSIMVGPVVDYATIRRLEV
ncbi:MAG: hypothetical protein H0Z39_03530 [Peptococcaceae bacterium]|nr:hypothetical protein [Peptococcaceae bacterium]